MNQNQEDALPQNMMSRKAHRCPRCKSPLEERVPRGFFVKYFLGVLPLRRYICYRCFRKPYVWHREEQ